MLYPLAIFSSVATSIGLDHLGQSGTNYPLSAGLVAAFLFAMELKKS